MRRSSAFGADYTTRCRVEQAAKLLHETKRSVTDIAMDLGFSSSQYFATVFKPYTRCSPRTARRSRVFLW
jgi:AraC-like DNA-binding protein